MVYKNIKLGQQDGSVNKGTCYQTQRPAFNPWKETTDSFMLFDDFHLCAMTWVHAHIPKINKEAKFKKMFQNTSFL